MSRNHIYCSNIIPILLGVETVQNRPDGSGRADLDVRHLEDALHLRPLTDSRPVRDDEAIHRSLLINILLKQIRETIQK